MSQIAVAVITGVCMVAAAVGGTVWVKRRSGPDTAASLATAAGSLVGESTDFVGEMRAEMADMRRRHDAQIAALNARLGDVEHELAVSESYVQILVAAMRSASIDVPPRPAQSGAKLKGDQWNSSRIAPPAGS